MEQTKEGHSAFGCFGAIIAIVSTVEREWIEQTVKPSICVYSLTTDFQVSQVMNLFVCRKELLGNLLSV